MRPFFVQSRGSHPISNNMWAVLFSEGVLVTPTKIRTRSLSYDNYRVHFFFGVGGGWVGWAYQYHLAMVWWSPEVRLRSCSSCKKITYPQGEYFCSWA